MDVLKLSLGLALIFGLSACGKAKSTESVYSKSVDSYCTQTRVQSKYIVEWEDGRFTTEYAPSEEAFKKNFIEPRLALIKKAEPDYLTVFQAPSSVITTTAEDPSDSWGQDIIEASSAWARNAYGQNILVGVVDSAVDMEHPQLQGNIAINADEVPNNGLDDDNNGYVDDVMGQSFISQGSSTTANPHGTHVSGIIAADPTSGPIAGIAPQAKLIPAPFISTEGYGSLGDAILALQYAASRGAKVINASWGGAPCVSALASAFTSLSDRGVLLVVAAGNSGVDIDRYPVYPASFNSPLQITVGASTALDFLSSWSNHGYRSVHLAAPGVQILSTTPGNSVSYMDGTSMAAPFVSGAAAAIWSAYPQASAHQIREALMRSVEIKSGHEFRVSTQGRLNVRRALEELNRMLP